MVDYISKYCLARNAVPPLYILLGTMERIVLDATSSFAKAATTLWLLLEGTAARSIRGRAISTLGPRSLVGAPSMLYDQPAIATVTALTPVRAVVAGKARFRAIGAIDTVILRLMAATADRLREYLPVDWSAGGPDAVLGVPAVAC